MAQLSEPIVCPGLFYAVPAQDGIISRLRTPGGLLTSAQSRVVAHFADQYGDGVIQITNRANLQIRAVRTVPPAAILTTLQAAGLAASRASVDHLRNIMASPTSGIDPQALIDTRALVTALDQAIVQHAEFAGLPAKFSVGLDGGEAVSVRNRPNDLWFVAMTNARPGTSASTSVIFRLYLNSGQGQELDTGLLLRPEDCIPTVVAIAHIYLAYLAGCGPEAHKKKPRLRQVVAQQGVAWYVEQVVRSLPFAVEQHPVTVGPSACVPPQYRHIGTHAQRQQGLSYCGVVTPLGRLTAHQLHELAHLAEVYGSGTLRLTPWQNVLIPDVPHQHLSTLSQALEALGLPVSATHPWSALVACAGSLGCRASATNTTQHAFELARALAQHNLLDHPLNLHLSGCPKSCAQHYPSDIALLGTAIPQGDATVEGYHVYVGTTEQPFGRVLYNAVPAAHLPALLVCLLQAYQTYRQSPDESFGAFANRYAIAELQQCVGPLAAPPDSHA